MRSWRLSQHLQCSTKALTQKIIGSERISPARFDYGGDMIYTDTYDSILGEIFLTGDDSGLISLSFTQHFSGNTTGNVLDTAKKWLDVYFFGSAPDFTPALALQGTSFQLKVWNALQRIPYGHTTTYGAIAQELSCRSAQAIGQAISRNPIAIIIPCHRVIGINGDLTGYAGGLERKAELLQLEGTKIPSC